MSDCKYLMRIDPYDPLCDNPMYYYGGAPTDADCDVCPYPAWALERENSRLKGENNRLRQMLMRAMLRQLEPCSNLLEPCLRVYKHDSDGHPTGCPIS